MFNFYRNMRYQMPVFFGGDEFDPNDGLTASDVSVITFVVETDPIVLADYLPAGFSLRSPTIHFQYLQLREVDELTGGGYNIVQATLPVHFEGQKDSLNGDLPLVIFENNVTPILGGRDFSGMPKIYADITDMSCYNGEFFSNASFNGNTFISFHINSLIPIKTEELSSTESESDSDNSNQFGIRYIPKVGAPGADLIQIILYPQTFKTYEAYTGTGSIEWTPLPPYKNMTHTRIVEQLSSLPYKSIATPTLIRGLSTMKSLRCRVIY